MPSETPILFISHDNTNPSKISMDSYLSCVYLLNYKNWNEHPYNKSYLAYDTRNFLVELESKDYDSCFRYNYLFDTTAKNLDALKYIIIITKCVGVYGYYSMAYIASDNIMMALSSGHKFYKYIGTMYNFGPRDDLENKNIVLNINNAWHLSNILSKFYSFHDI